MSKTKRLIRSSPGIAQTPKNTELRGPFIPRTTLPKHLQRSHHSRERPNATLREMSDLMLSAKLQAITTMQLTVTPENKRGSIPTATMRSMTRGARIWQTPAPTQILTNTEGATSTRGRDNTVGSMATTANPTTRNIICKSCASRSTDNLLAKNCSKKK